MVLCRHRCRRVGRNKFRPLVLNTNRLPDLCTSQPLDPCTSHLRDLCKDRLQDRYKAHHPGPNTSRHLGRCNTPLQDRYVGVGEMDPFMREKIKLYVDGAKRLGLGNK